LRRIRNKASINSLKLSKFFNVSENFFINIQSQYDLDKAKEKAENSLSKIIPFKRKEISNNSLLETLKNT